MADRRLPAVTIATVAAVIRDSLHHALADPAAALPTMRAFAQEVDDRVLMQHVETYVNDWTVDLGPTGRRALETLADRAAAVGLATGRLAFVPAAG